MLLTNINNIRQQIAQGVLYADILWCGLSAGAADNDPSAPGGGLGRC